MMLSITEFNGDQYLHRCQCGKDTFFESVALSGGVFIFCTYCGHSPYLPNATEVRTVNPPFPWKDILKSLPTNGLVVILILIAILVCMSGKAT